MANVNFFTTTSYTYTYAVHPVSYTECGEITQNKGHYVVQGHWLLILLPIESSYIPINTICYLLSCTVSEI